MRTTSGPPGSMYDLAVKNIKKLLQTRFWADHMCVNQMWIEHCKLHRNTYIVRESIVNVMDIQLTVCTKNILKFLASTRSSGDQGISPLSTMLTGST